MNFIKVRAKKFQKWFKGLFNKKPAYFITENGIKVKYFNFSNIEKYPFDKDTYENCQVFVGDWANPVSINMEDFKDEYGQLDYQEAQSLGPDIIEAEHIKPSQQYKIYMNNKALKNTFQANAVSDNKKLMYMLYAVLALLGIIIVVIAGLMV